MKSDFIFISIALGTIVCVTCAYPTSSSEIQPDRGKDHASIAKDLLALLDKADDTQEDQNFENDNAIRSGGQGAQAIGNGYKIQTSSSQLYDDSNNNMRAKEQVTIVGTILGSVVLPYAVEKVVEGVENLISKRKNGSEDGPGYRYTNKHPDGYPDGSPTQGPPGHAPPLLQYNDPSSNEDLLEQELLRVANEQAAPFRRTSFITKPDEWKLKPNYKRGFFETIKQFFKSLYQLEQELLRVANEQAAPFRRTSFITKPDEWKLKPNYKRGFFETIKQFFKNLYQD